MANIGAFKSKDVFRHWINEFLAGLTPLEIQKKNLYSPEHIEELVKACTGDGTKLTNRRLIRTVKDRKFFVPSEGELKGKLCKHQSDKGGDSRTVVVCPIPDIEYVIWLKHCGEKGHVCGRDRTCKAINEQYAGVPEIFVEEYKKHCEICRIELGKRAESRHKPSPARQPWECHQLELIDLRELPCKLGDVEYRWVLHIRDQMSRWSYLQPLPENEADRVVEACDIIYSVEGPPSIVQTNTLASITADVLTPAFKGKWPRIQVLDGTDGSPHLHYALESANAFVEEQIRCFTRDHPGLPWAGQLFLNSIAWGMNTTYHTDIKGTPYKCKYGFDPRLEERSKVEHVEPVPMVTGAAVTLTQESCKRSNPFDAGPSGRGELGELSAAVLAAAEMSPTVQASIPNNAQTSHAAALDPPLAALEPPLLPTADASITALPTPSTDPAAPALTPTDLTDSAAPPPPAAPSEPACSPKKRKARTSLPEKPAVQPEEGTDLVSEPADIPEAAKPTAEEDLQPPMMKAAVPPAADAPKRARKGTATRTQ